MVADLHCDTILKILAGEDFIGGSENLEVTLPQLIAGDVGLQIFAAFVSSAFPSDGFYKEARRLLDGIDDLIGQYSDRLKRIDNAEQMRTLGSSGFTGLMKAVENGQAIENSLAKLEVFRKEGVRYMTLTHSRNHDWAASSAEERCNFDGLTVFGEKVIEAMNDLGVIIDVSHVHETTFWKAVKRTRKPVIASHSNAFRLCRINRNLTDDQIRAIADTGGMVGINFFPGFLDELYLEKMNTFSADLFAEYERLEQESLYDPRKFHQKTLEWNDAFRKKMALHTVTLNRIVDHIEYIIDLAGDDCVGFGSDFDGVPDLPGDIRNAGDIVNIIKRLKERKFSDEQIEKICWRNFYRVLELND